MDREIQQQFNRLNAKLNTLIEHSKKEHWVKVGFITRVTGWDGETLRQAREQGLVRWKIDPMLGKVYLLESIPEIFIRHENKTIAGAGNAGMDFPLAEPNEKVKP